MVLGLLSAVAACPAIIGTTEAVRQGQKSNAREKHRGRKVNLVIRLPNKNEYSPRFDESLIVLKDGKLYIQHSDSKFQPGTTHTFAGYYLPYPDNQDQWKTAGWIGEGLVTTINAENHLNWVYVDRETQEVRYGTKSVATDNLTGPWDCTQVDRRMTFEGWEGFVIVQENEEEDLWALYFDRHDNGLSNPGLIGDVEGRGKRVRMLEVQISRKERPKDREMATEERIERIRKIKALEKKQQEEGLQGAKSAESAEKEQVKKEE